MSGSRWLSWYRRCLQDHPIRTNIASGTTVTLCGDALAQTIEQRTRKQTARADVPQPAGGTDPTRAKTRSEPWTTGGDASRLSGIYDGYDPSRTAVMVSWSAVGDVPLNMLLLSAVGRVVRPLGIPAVGASLPQCLLKGVLFFVPGVMIRMPCLIAYVTTCEHCLSNALAGRPPLADPAARSLRIRRKISQNLSDVVSNGARLWIPVNTLAFYAVPAVYRPLALSGVGVGWMAYLSIVQHAEGGEEGV